MAFMNQDKKKVIKANLDKVLKPLGIKYSLRVRDYMSITCTIKSGGIDFIGNLRNRTGAAFDLHSDRGYVQVNPYWFNDHFTGERIHCKTCRNNRQPLDTSQRATFPKTTGRSAQW